MFLRFINRNLRNVLKYFSRNLMRRLFGKFWTLNKDNGKCFDLNKRNLQNM